MIDKQLPSYLAPDAICPQATLYCNLIYLIFNVIKQHAIYNFKIFSPYKFSFEKNVLLACL